MTVVPLFCARFIKAPAHHGTPSAEEPVTVDQPRRRRSFGDRFNVWFNDRFEAFPEGLRPAVSVVLAPAGLHAARLRRRLRRSALRCFRCSASRSSRARMPVSS